MRKIILKTIAAIMGILFIVSGCMLDSASWIPYIVCVISAAWLALFAYANKMFYWQEDKR